LNITTKPVYDSARQSNPALTELKELSNYWYLLKQLVRRDILTRYKRSALGVAWTMLNPLGTMLIMSFVFSNLFHTVGNYSIYLLSGLLVWNFFAQSTSAAMSGLVWGGSLMKQNLRTQDDIWDFCHRHRYGKYGAEPCASVPRHSGNAITDLLDHYLCAYRDSVTCGFFDWYRPNHFDPGSLFSGCLGDVPDPADGVDVPDASYVP
jgi:hypothetical protein